MIGIKGQWEFRFELNGRDDLITSKNLVQYTTTNETGNIVPSFSIVFDTAEQDIKYLLKNKNILKVMYGDGNYFNPAQEWISLKSEQGRGESKTRVTMEGILNVLPYITQTKIFISELLNSSDVITSVASKYFFVSSEINTDDKQYWIQPNISDRRYVSELLKFSNLPNSFIISGIDEFSFFKMKDGIKLLDEEPLYTLHYAGSSGGAGYIPFMGDFHALDRTGVIACWLGKERSKSILTFEDGISEQLDINFDDFNPNDDRADSLGYRFSNEYMINENTHKEIQNSSTRNLAGLGHFSNNQINVEYGLNKIDSITVLEVVNFIDDRPDTLKRQAQDNISGKYIVGKMIQTVTSKEYSKCLYLYRPSNR